MAAAGAGGASTPPALFVVEHASNAPGGTAPVVFLLAPVSGTSLAASSVSIYVPAGYALDLTAPVGTKVGSVITVPAFDASDLSVADPAAFVSDPCAPGTHAAVWTGSVPIGGVATTVPVFVDPTAGDESARGAYRLTYCQPSLALFELTAGITAPTSPGSYTWHAFVTPSVAGGGTPDPSTVYELRSVVALPHALKAKATYSTRTNLLTISGKATAAAGADANASVDIEQVRGTKLTPFASTRTNAAGTFTVKRRVTQTASARTLTFDAGSVMEPGDCTDPPLAPAGCLLQSYAASSDAVFKARIPAKSKPKKR